MPDIVRQWPVFDPAAGYAESQFERGLGEAWLRHHSRLLEPSLPSEGDRMMLAMALQLHQGQPSATFADLVDQSAHASQLLTEAALARPTAATAPLDASPSVGPTFSPPSAT
ncbi:MAG: hypothetical protein H3C62_00315 [Gemmatimonadaceae bacterium]|nr:hypothetical protein [Gemmatimonadaceae bacterium]